MKMYIFELTSDNFHSDLSTRIKDNFINNNHKETLI